LDQGHASAPDVSHVDFRSSAPAEGCPLLSALVTGLYAVQDSRLVAGTEGEEMNRLRRFYEKMPYGIKSSRVAYVIDAAALPEALPDAEWKEDLSFRAAESVLGNPGLKAVYLMALEKGCAVVTTPTAKPE